MRDIFGIILIFIQASIAIPMLLALLKEKKHEGISLSSELIWVSVGIGWVLYGLMANSLVLVISGSIASFSSGCICLLIWEGVKKEQAGAMIVGVSFGLLIGLSSWLGGVYWLSITLSVIGVVQFLPQLIKSIKMLVLNIKSFGVSILGTTMRSIYTFSWAVYGGAWFLWGIKTSQINWPLVSWGLIGALTFAIQAFVALKSKTKTII